MKSNDQDEDNGFAEWGGYMAAKKAKLAKQYEATTCNLIQKTSNIFKGVAIFVNGYTNPTAEELKILMAAHGGVYHHYQMSGTTHIIASILPNAKVKQMGSVPIVQASWISDSISSKKLLDYRKYLLYTNQNCRQPTIDFPKKTLTAADPGFLSEFYNNSLTGEIDRYISRQRNLKLLSTNAVLPPYETIVMHIDMDCFFVSVGLRSRPHLRGQCVVVTHAQNTERSINRPKDSVDTENELLQKYYSDEHWEKLDPHASMSEIACCSYEARRRGVRNGMFLGAALKICPELKAIPYDFEGYREVSTVLYKTLAKYTLDIEAVSCDEMYVDVTPILNTCGISVDQWADHIRREIMDATGCPSSTGFGANRLQARLATKKAKPAGKFHLRPEDVDDYMSNIPLSDLPGVGHATVSKLNKLGLIKCGDLHSITLAQLRSELGVKIGETVMDFARGVDRKPLNFQHERKSISADVNYGIRFKDKDVGMRARCLNLKLLVRAPEAPIETAKFLGCGICNTINRSTTTGGLIADAATIYKEAKNLFEKVNVAPHELRGVGIQLTRLEKAAPTNSVLKRFLQNENVITKETKPVRENKIPKINVDLSVLKELPEEIQAQIIKEYKLDPRVAAKRDEVIEPKEKPSAFDRINWDDLKPILLRWLESTNAPKEVDINMLGEHFKTLAVDRKIERLKVGLNFLYRHIAQMGSCQWHDAYWTIVDLAQQGMVHGTAALLWLNETFVAQFIFKRRHKVINTFYFGT
ncbi:hypothetical protein FQR65_LT00254 [Abscondita terminalis]|nr:hypothetical protein FQR65_LT00254 [Abscondita terminalis]